MRMISKDISPYISEGSGLKRGRHEMGRGGRAISPYISEGSGLKRIMDGQGDVLGRESPLTSVRGAD